MRLYHPSSVCYDVCRAARSAPRRCGPRRTRSPGIPYGLLLLGVAEQFLVQIGWILDGLADEVLEFEDQGRWIRQQPVLREVFSRFLQGSSDAPVLLWATPIWYLMSSYMKRSAKVKTVDCRPAIEWLGSPASNGSRFHLPFGPGQAPVEVDLRQQRLTLFSPDEWGSGKLEVIRVSRERGGICPGGHQVPTAFEYSVCLAPRGEEYWLARGKLPAHTPLYRRSDNGAPSLVNSCSITLAKLRPSSGALEAWVDHVAFFFARDSGHVVEVNTSRRDFDLFVQQRLGLREALECAIFRKEF